MIYLKALAATGTQTIFLPKDQNEYTYEPISGCADVDYTVFLDGYLYEVVSDGMKKATCYRDG